MGFEDIWVQSWARSNGFNIFKGKMLISKVFHHFYWTQIMKNDLRIIGIPYFEVKMHDVVVKN
jgi:hypothetical protein